MGHPRLQVVHYSPAQEYRPHFDWFSGSDARLGEKLALRGNRFVSVFVYLQLPEVGGCSRQAQSAPTSRRPTRPPIAPGAHPFMQGCTPGAREEGPRRLDAKAILPTRSRRSRHAGPSRRTAFPQLQQSFQPEAGGALLWYNLDRHGTADERTLHAGEPVARGEKWGMNIWLRERAAPRRVWPRVRLALSLLPGGTVRAQLAIEAPANTATGDAMAPRCGVCGSTTSPLGLCLCQAQYA